MDQPQPRNERSGLRGGNSREPSAGNTSDGPLRRNDESWVEVSSQTSSSVSSIGGDEIVTTGLRVGHSMNPRRRRLQQGPIPRSYHADQTAIHAAGASSQEEYDETESEEDRLMTSSTEGLHIGARQSFQRPMQVESEDSDDDDDHATALGRRTDDHVFRPQPNAFSHPPHLSHRSQSATSAVPPHPHSHVRPSLAQRSQTRVHRNPPNFMSPASQADNDEALRSSLTTLLSCAAAARGLPKHKETDQRGAATASRSNGVGPSTQPVELRLVPEADLMGAPPAPAAGVPSPTTQPKPTASRSRANTSPLSSPLSEGTPRSDAKQQHKRVSSQNRSSSARAAKKKKVAADEASTMISPTVLTWVVSAGVVVLVSVVGFGAGYVIGREVGRQEGLSAAGMGSAGTSVNASSLASEGTSCGREVIRSSGGLRRLRWGTSVVASS